MTDEFKPLVEAVDFIEIARRVEPLHSDLEPYLVEVNGLGTCLKHPLVFDIPFFSAAMANYQYHGKKIMLAKSVENENWYQYVFLHERPFRFSAFTDIAPLITDRVDYWELFRSVWIDSENLFQVEGLSDLLHQEDVHLIMDESERLTIEGATDLTIYRGVQEGGTEAGWSWTIDRERAEWFARRFRDSGRVLVATVDRSQIIAFIRGRGEDEVIVDPTLIEWEIE